MNKKGILSVIALIFIVLLVFIILAIALNKPTADIEIKFGSSTIKSGQTTDVQVTVTNPKDETVTGKLVVRAKTGTSYVTLTTEEESGVSLVSKGSSVTKVYSLLGITDVKVHPMIEAVLVDNAGNSVGKAQEEITIKP